MASTPENDPFTEPNSEDDFDWEEVEVPEHQLEQRENIEITIPLAGSRSKKGAATSKFKGIPHAERLRRIDCHKVHTVVLLGNALIRNKWLNDELLHARLLSVAPLMLQNAFAVIHKSRVPDQNQRGRMFEQAITNLAEWWSSYFEVAQEGHIRNRTYEDVEAKLAKLGLPLTDPDAVPDIEDIEDLTGYDHEPIRSVKSLMKHALMQSGSRDVSAQLFTALCRALGIPARLVVSLQSVPWQTNVGKPKPTYTRKPKGGKGKGKDTGAESGADDENLEDKGDQASTSRSDSEGPSKGGAVFTGDGQRLDGAPVRKSEKAKGKEKAAPVIRLRKTKSKGHVLGSAPKPGPSKLVSPDPTTTPPVFWTEVFSRPDARWIPVDPIRCIVNKRKVFDPTPINSIGAPAVNSPLFPQAYAAVLNRRAVGAITPNRSVRQENRMVYVLAFEEDGFARDVTRRYAREFGAKIAKVQGGSSTIGGGGKARLAWWETIVGLVSRPYRLNRDDVEDEELEAAQMMEGMPMTISGFKDHPLYALTRHLKQNQVIHPPPPDTSEIGKFRGEPVYPRSAVISLKTAENWMRSEGRMVREGTQPLKLVKIRAGTINRMRELEVMKDELKEAGDPASAVTTDTMQGLYARSQTEPYVPDPVFNGKVPKNNFGNIDLYVPSMLPHGGVHVPFKGIAKVAKKLGFDFAEAVVGFEFKKRRAFPVIEGIVVAQDNESALLEAYWEAEQDAEEKARVKREERVLKQWTRLVHGLRIRQRLQAQYATKPYKEQDSQDDMVNTNNDGQPGTSKDIVITMSHPSEDSGGGGGFVVGADDVVQPFHLPRYKYQPAEPMVTTTNSSHPHEPLDQLVKAHEEPHATNSVLEPEGLSYEPEMMDIDSEDGLEEADEVGTTQPQFADHNNLRPAPKTMQELAEDAASQFPSNGDATDNNDGVEIFSDTYRPPPSLTSDRDAGDVPRIKIVPRATRVKLKLANNDTATSHTGASSSASSSAPKAAANTGPPIRKVSARVKSKKRARGDIMDSDSDSDDDLPVPTPKKRATRTSRGNLVSTPSPSTRTLRPRVSKTPSQLREAAEQEEAYRSALRR